MLPSNPQDIFPDLDQPGISHDLSKADFYSAAGKSENTERAFTSSIKHYRDWGGMLPAGADEVRAYLGHFAGQLKVSTLRQRLNQISKWHKRQCFPDPTVDELVKRTMRGISKLHQTQTKQAYPLKFQHLLGICDRLEAAKIAAISENSQVDILRIHRDLALILIGFWHGFRSDELSRLRAEHITANRRQGITVFLPYSKTDTQGDGKSYQMDGLLAYCPASAYLDWIQVAGINAGPVFRQISRWGVLGLDQINKHSIERILNRVAVDLFPDEPKFSTHSLRRGFADWAVNEGWDLKTLMGHVGWKSVESAQRYMPSRKSFGALSTGSGSGALANEPEMPGAGSVLLAAYARVD
ncbi:tyrosine-type recombinase/integrase [Pseudomonas tritici]|uniref:tyrosine-type recombinase/integrase n=1 Tax=Pseudomonas tritici TaxID=2745518 RepID=UPI00387ACD10